MDVLGDRLTEQGDPVGARAAWVEAVELLEPLAAQYPDAEPARRLAIIREQLAKA